MLTYNEIDLLCIATLLFGVMLALVAAISVEVVTAAIAEAFEQLQKSKHLNVGV